MAQTPLWQDIDLSPSLLGSEGAQRFIDLSQKPMFDEVKIHEIGDLVDHVDGFGNINVNSSCGILKFQSTNITYESPEEYSWTGKYINYVDTSCAVCSGLDFYIYRNEDGMIGSFADHESSYSLFGLGGDYVAFARLDTAFNSDCGVADEGDDPENPNDLPDDEYELDNEEPKQSKIYKSRIRTQRVDQDGNNNGTQNLQSRTGTICTVDVLVVSTTAANAISPVTVAGPAAIAEFNQIAMNSDIDQCDLQLRLVGTAVYNYAASFSRTDVTITFPGDATLTALRNAANADIVIVLHDNSYGATEGIFGEVAAILASNVATSYAHVDINTAIGGIRVFSHEVSHLLGGRHHNDNTNKPARARTWSKCFRRRNTTTIGGARETIPHFSNPDVDFDGRKTGKKNRNNASILRGNACPVGGIVTSVEPFSITLSSEPTPCTCVWASVTAQTNSSASGAISYEWEKSADGVNWTPTAYNSSSISLSIPCLDGEATFVRVTAEDAAGSIAVEQLSVPSPGPNYPTEGCPQFGPSNPGGNNPTEFITQIDKNNIQIDFNEDLESKGYTLSVVDGLGRVIASRNISSFSGGKVMVELDFIPNPGVFVLADQTGKVIQSQIVTR